MKSLPATPTQALSAPKEEQLTNQEATYQHTSKSLQSLQTSKNKTLLRQQTKHYFFHQMIAPKSANIRQKKIFC